MQSAGQPATARGGRRFRLAAGLLNLVTAACSIAFTAGAAPPPETTPRPLLALSVGGWFFASEDMQRTYGAVPTVGLWIHINDGPSAQYFLGVQYGARRGDNNYGDPVFESGGNAKVTAVPIEFGLRANLRRRHRPGIFLGIAGDYIRTWETVRGTHRPNPEVPETIRNWALGLRLLAGPEVEIGRGHWVAGSEFSVGGSFTPSEPHDNQRTIDLAGLAVRAYVARRL
jgi:hypothetical protein